MVESANIKSKSRGIIIVDTCCLINMCKKPTLSKDKDSFLDTLAYLAQHGFTVIIPEFVVIEATNKCPTKRLEAVLKKVRSKPLSHADNRKKFLDFFEKNKEYLFFEKAKPEDRLGNSLPHFDICRLVREAVDMAEPTYADSHSIPSNYNKTPQEYWEQRVNSNINTAMRAAHNQPDLGECHCFRVMLDHIIEEHLNKPNDPKTPIYLLSDDGVNNREMFHSFATPLKEQIKGWSQNIKHLPVLHFLTTAGFFRALGNDKSGRETSILKRIGFKESPEEIVRNIYEEPSRFSREWNSTMRDKAILTSHPQYTPAFPFNEVISGLRYDLEQDAKKNGARTMADRYGQLRPTGRGGI